MTIYNTSPGFTSASSNKRPLDSVDETVDTGIAKKLKISRQQPLMHRVINEPLEDNYALPISSASLLTDARQSSGLDLERAGPYRSAPPYECRVSVSLDTFMSHKRIQKCTLLVHVRLFDFENGEELLFCGHPKCIRKEDGRFPTFKNVAWKLRHDREFHIPEGFALTTGFRLRCPAAGCEQTWVRDRTNKMRDHIRREHADANLQYLLASVPKAEECDSDGRTLRDVKDCSPLMKAYDCTPVTQQTMVHPSEGLSILPIKRFHPWGEPVCQATYASGYEYPITAWHVNYEKLWRIILPTAPVRDGEVYLDLSPRGRALLL